MTMRQTAQSRSAHKSVEAIHPRGLLGRVVRTSTASGKGSSVIPFRATISGAEGDNIVTAKFNWKKWLDGFASVAMLGATGFVLFTYISNRGTAPLERRATVDLVGRSIPLEGVASAGASTAKVGLVVFSDFECPYCAQFAERTQPELSKAYVDTGLAKIYFRHLPLPTHKGARFAAEVADCFAGGAAFWKAHDVLFGLKGRLDLDSVQTALQPVVGTNSPECYKPAPRVVERIDADLALAASLKISSTPAFLVGTIASDNLIVTEVLFGSLAVDRFGDAIERGLATVR